MRLQGNTDTKTGIFMGTDKNGIICTLILFYKYKGLYR
jgi:hypothetical protein